MVLAQLKSRFVIALTASALLMPAFASAQDEQGWRKGISTVGDLKHTGDFSHFDYVNPNAPKGGTLQLSAEGSFDTLNPLLARGEVGEGLGLVYETLMTSALDEISSMYGLLAESLKYPDDFSSVTFRLRAEATWSDGKPVTPEDVVFSFEQAKKSNPQMEFYYRHVVSAEKTAEREVTFKFDEPNNRELPQIVGQLLIVPKHWWAANGTDGKPRDITKTTLEVPMGSGPYRVAAVTPGSTIRYERRDDYWGKDVNVNVGQNNFGSIVYSYFADRDVMFEAFRSGNTDYWWENSARRWATAYNFPAVNDGRIKREELENEMRKVGVMVGFIFNTRRDKFADPRVREALNYAFDFEELKRTIFYGSYDRVDSYFFRTELASSGLPQGRELEILNEVKDLVPPRVFTEPYSNPVNGDPAKLRDNLRKAVAMLKEAGYELKGNRMVNTKTGQPLSFEIMLGGPTIEPVALSFSQNLKKIGIDATVRSVEQSQFTNRWRSRDFDVMYNAWGESMNPGNEQAEYWGSDAAKREGSQNYSGISDPGIDALIKKVIFSKDRDDLVAAVHALDRVLLAHHIVVPSYSSKSSRIAYWGRLAHPENLPEYSLGMPTVWWSAEAGK
ncbi:extracellular solute-binding protein [Rhizobium sp. RM]|uniref:extracellular solute-binding protein n=1 Tax=Rhizobium sp. RM TaxID=2748079 RepID=UPI00110ED58E|nr:extracellular solute-binding protein [Rhizobium sp. RM]NWJ24507.1 ABC transporter substrate-binding protein [Rhizobium sp. RM]TMV16321.1 ABC transporter substrate-binding protein [Rhizobium sp. Td3]